MSPLFIFANLAAALLSCQDEADRIERQKTGTRYIEQRLPRWEECLEDGLVAAGRIVSTHESRRLSECWIEHDYYLIKLFQPDGRLLISLGNPEYSAMVTQIDSKYTLMHVGDPVVHGLQTVPIEAVPFVSTSSICNTRVMIPHEFRKGQLVVVDYHFRHGKHIVELEANGGSEKELMTLTFDDRVESSFPIELQFHENVVMQVSDFEDVVGYSLPRTTRQDSPGLKAVVNSVCNPSNRLDHRSCRLSAYGLPEPGSVEVVSLGQNRAVFWPLALIVAIVCAASGGFWFVRRSSGG